MPPSPAGRVAARVGARGRRLADRLGLERRLAVDARAIAALRVALGLLLLADLALRARHLRAFYTDAGVLPRSTLFDLYPAARFSLHALSGAAWVVWLLVGAAGVAALALLVGYRTPLATAASLVLLASLHARNPLVLNGGDTLLRRLLFWGVLLPLGARWSLDGLDRAVTTDARDPRVASAATAALLVQVVLVYTVAGAFKLRSDRWLAGTELAYVLRLDQLTRPVAAVLLGLPLLLRGLTWLWLAMALGAGLLVVLTGRRRTALVALFAAMHVGMFLTLRLGLFPLVSLAALLPFLPPAVWDRVEAALAPRWRRAVGGLRGVVDRIDGVDQRLAVAIGRPDEREPSRLAGDVASSRPGAALVALLLSGALVWNAMSLGIVATPDAVASVRDPGEHAWDMFAGGERVDGWFVVPARLESGERVDLWSGSAVSWTPPPDLTRRFPSARWLRYSLSLLSTPAVRAPFAAQRCRRWNRDHADDATSVTVTFVRQSVEGDGSTTVERVRLGRYRCPDGAAA